MSKSRTSTTAILQLTVLSYVVSPSVRVLVGTEKPCAREFFAHEALICQRSRFFANAMNGSWIESDERKVPLPEDEPDVFALYLKVLYVHTPRSLLLGWFADDA